MSSTDDEEKATKRSVSFPPSLLDQAQAKADAHHGGNLSRYIQKLITDDVAVEALTAAPSTPPILTALLEIRDLLKAGARVPSSDASSDSALVKEKSRREEPGAKPDGASNRRVLGGKPRQKVPGA